MDDEFVFVVFLLLWKGDFVVLSDVDDVCSFGIESDVYGDVIIVLIFDVINDMGFSVG